MKYIIDTAKIDAITRAYNEMNVEIYYPTKVNANEKLINVIDSRVKGYEVDSINHIKALIERHDVSPYRILFSYPLKKKEEICRAIELGIRRFVVDNIDECKFIVNNSADIDISLFIRLSIAEAIEADSGCFFKWGAPLEETLLMKETIQSSACTFEGISFYLPQEVNSVENFKKVFHIINDKIGLSDCSYLDIGGGIDIEVLKTLSPLISQMTDISKTRVIIESGRHMVGPCIDMITEIIGIRVYSGMRVAFLDTGIYNGLLDTVVKGSKFTIVADNNLDFDLSDLCEFLVCGKSSDVSDIIGHYYLPTKLKLGDKLRIIGCGAYCSVLETNFYKEVDSIYELI